MILDPVYVVGRCRLAGFVFGHGLDTIVAIGKAESGLDEDAVSPLNTDGTIDIGWPQINSNHLPGGKYRTLATNAEAVLYASQTLRHDWKLDDLKVCAHAAVAAWILSEHGERFTPWTTYGSGAYKPHMMLAQTARKLADLSARHALALSALTEAEVARDTLGNKIAVASAALQ